MQIAAILINVLKDNSNLLKNIDLYLSSSHVSTVIVVANSSENKDKINSYLENKYEQNKALVIMPNDNTSSYVEMMKAGISAVQEEHCFIVPDTIVTTDKFIGYAINCYKPNKSVVLLSSQDNKKIDNLEKIEQYNLYKLYNLKPVNEDYYNVVLLDKQLIIDAPSDFTYHYLFSYLSKEQLQQNNLVISVVNERIKVNNIDKTDGSKNKNLVIFVAKKYGLINEPKLTFFERLFSLKKMNGRFYLSLLFCKVNFKLKLQPKFPKDAKEFEYVGHVSNIETIHNACIFASFTANGKVSVNTLNYLKSLKCKFDYLVYVADSKCTSDNFDKIKSIVDAAYILRHNEYDFGSYKIGFNHLRKHNLLDKIENLLLCNDSVDFVGSQADLSDIISKSQPFEAFSLCKATYGFGDRIKNSHSYEWVKYPHLQSYFLLLKKPVFTSEYFSSFIDGVTFQKHKSDIIKLYEMGLTKLLTEHNVTMSSYYPYDDTNIVNPYAIYLNQYVDKPIFVKHMLTK